MCRTVHVWAMFAFSICILDFAWRGLDCIVTITCFGVMFMNGRFVFLMNRGNGKIDHTHCIEEFALDCLELLKGFVQRPEICLRSVKSHPRCWV